jgi:hypothetical protein
MSFPYISKLIEKDVVELIITKRVERIKNSQSEYQFVNSIPQKQKEWLINQDIEVSTSKVKGEVENCFSEVKELVDDTLKGNLLLSIKELRNKHLAHYLDKSKPAQEITERPTIKFGAPKELLDISIKCCDLLGHVIKDLDYNFSSYQELARKNTVQLWHNCKFDIPKN